MPTTKPFKSTSTIKVDAPQLSLETKKRSHNSLYKEKRNLQNFLILKLVT